MPLAAQAYYPKSLLACERASSAIQQDQTSSWYNPADLRTLQLIWRRAQGKEWFRNRPSAPARVERRAAVAGLLNGARNQQLTDTVEFCPRLLDDGVGQREWGRFALRHLSGFPSV